MLATSRGPVQCHLEFVVEGACFSGGMRPVLGAQSPDFLSNLKRTCRYPPNAGSRRATRRAPTTAAVLSIVVVFLLCLALRVGGKAAVRDYDDIVTALAALAACLSCLSAAWRATSAVRRFWVLLALALGAWTAAEVIWAAYDLVLHVAVPVPSWADVGYLAGDPSRRLRSCSTLVCALRESQDAGDPGRHRDRSRGAVAELDPGAGAPLAPHPPHDGWGHSRGLVYPFGDMVIIFFVVLSVSAMTTAGRRPLLWVLVGLFAMAVADSRYTYLVEIGRYATGNIVDLGWVVGYLSIAVGASSETGQVVVAPPDEAVGPSLVSLVAPFVPVLLALLLVTFELEIHHHVDRVMWLTGFGLALLAIACQLSAL